MKEILKTTEYYRVEKWINSNTYAIIFFDEMRYIDGKLNKNFIEKPDHMKKTRILQPYHKIKKYL